jgi:aminomethyltransferase
VIISRTGFSNELGWELYLRPENDAIAIGEKIWCFGKRYDMILTGTPAFRARRIEAGLLSAGNDFDRTTTPFDVGLGRFVDMTKKEFIGRAALKKCTKNNKILGVKVQKGIAKRGHFFSNEGKILGNITSSTWSPYFECGVGIVRIKDAQAVEGLEVNVEGIDGKLYLGQLCQLPMYDKDGLIVRGKVSAIPTKPKPWDG